MDMKLEHASIICKRISSFARAVLQIFHFYFGKPTFGGQKKWARNGVNLKFRAYLRLNI